MTKSLEKIKKKCKVEIPKVFAYKKKKTLLYTRFFIFGRNLPTFHPLDCKIEILRYALLYTQFFIRKYCCRLSWSRTRLYLSRYITKTGKYDVLSVFVNYKHFNVSETVFEERDF